MASKRILVTGGAGFLGSHLCEKLLAQGHTVICLDNLFTGRHANIEPLFDNRRFEFIRHDVNEPFSMEVDQIFHLACPASPVHYQRNPVRTIRTCVQGTLNTLDVAREVGARVLIASTSEVYGDPAVHPQTEGYWGNVNPIGPRACYDEGKRCAEALAVSYARQYDVPVRIARIFNTYGPRMQEDDGRVISNFIVQALRGESMTIYGDGSQTRSFCYVDDLLEGLVRFMDVETDATPMNIGNPNEVSIAEIARTIRDMLGARVDMIQQALPPDDPQRRLPDISRAKALLGWAPTIALKTGLERTIEDFRRRSGAS